MSAMYHGIQNKYGDYDCLMCTHKLYRHSVMVEPDNKVTVFCNCCRGKDGLCKPPHRFIVLLGTLILLLSVMILWIWINHLPLWQDIVTSLVGIIFWTWWIKRRNRKRLDDYKRKLS